MTQPEERDLAHEADMRALMKQQLHDNISVEEANEEARLREENEPIDDRDDLMGDPDEYDEHYCICSAQHGIEELDSNQCECCGLPID